jgi:hypothetical protein
MLMNKKQMIEMIFEKSEFLKDFRQCPYSNNVLKCHKDVKCDNCIKKKKYLKEL